MPLSNNGYTGRKGCRRRHTKSVIQRGHTDPLSRAETLRQSSAGLLWDAITKQTEKAMEGGRCNETDAQRNTEGKLRLRGA